MRSPPPECRRARPADREPNAGSRCGGPLRPAAARVGHSSWRHVLQARLAYARAACHARQDAAFPRAAASCKARRVRRITLPESSMTAIIDINAREILDSRGNPTVEVDVR